MSSLIVHTIFVSHCFQLIQQYNNNNCLFNMLHRQLFAILLTTRSLNTQLHLRMTEFLLTVVCFALPFYSPTHLVQQKFLKQKVLAFSRTLSQPYCYFVHLYTYLSLMLVVVLFQCICVVYIVYVYLLFSW